MPNTVDYDYVICQHCGQRFGAITVPHLRSRHGYTSEHPVREYKERFALATASSAEVRGRLTEHKIEFWEGRKQHWTHEKILGEIRRRYQAGESLQSKQVPNSLMLAASRRFGSWGVALQMTGLDYDAITLHRHWDREKVIAEIRKLEADQVPLNSSWIKRRYGDLYRAAIKLFPSSWGKALQAAGFDPFEHKKRRGRWTRKQAEAWVRKRIDKSRSLLAGDSPRDLRQFVRDALKTTWTEFIESFGIPYPGIKKRRDWSRELVLEEIRRWAAEGHRTNRKSVSREFQALVHQGLKYFDSWDAARVAAGVAIDRGRAAKPPRPVDAGASPVEAKASAVAHSQMPMVNSTVTVAPRQDGDVAASRSAENGARRSTVTSREAELRAPGHQVATGHASRRLASEGGHPAPRDPILAFLARGGIDEPTAAEELSAATKPRETN